MRSKKSAPESSELPSRKAETPDEAAKNGRTDLSRRKLISRIGLGATLLAIGGQAYALFRSLVPNVLYENPQRFKVGTVDQFSEGAKFIDDKRIFIFREKNTFHCISATCTHLGCTVKMQRLNQPKSVNVRGRVINEQAEFACPCHGSKYYGDGTNYAGPAPKPLPHFKLEIAPEDGQLVVDTSQTVPQDFRLTV
ncbi:MAG TPA: Rieske (2Fe-2S) protein [Pyrinomonadaceae bacterium]|nr:Rieske (2Fe-2S) protein [Pyrinomonadaceae bacterium]